MPTYVFKGRNRLNEIVVGERVADNREALRQILRREQVTLTSVKEKGREIGIPKIGGRKKVKSKDLSVFTRQFSVMIDAGLPLVQCLEILAQQQDNKYFQQVLLQVRQDVEEGSTLAAAMARHPRVFDQLYTNMVEAGETGGILDLDSATTLDLHREDREVKTRHHLGDDLSVGGYSACDRRGRGNHDRRYSAVSEYIHGSAWTRRTVAVADANRRRHQQLSGGLGRTGHTGFSVIGIGVAIKFYYKTPGGQKEYRSTASQSSDPRRHLPQDRGRTLFANAFDVALVRCADLAVAGHHREDIR